MLFWEQFTFDKKNLNIILKVPKFRLILVISTMKIKRDLKKTIEQFLFKGKIIIVYGPRQVGKTTLVKELIEKYGDEDSYIDCEILENKNALEDQNPYRLRQFLGKGKGKFFVLDEAQKIKDIGTILKILIDTYQDLQIIATGSSSFDLSNKINEPLTGRAYEFTLYPVSWNELKNTLPSIELRSLFPQIFRFGAYPNVINLDDKEKILYLSSVASNYLYKDIFNYEFIKKPDLLLKLLKLIAFQVGSEVSINELAVKLEVSKNTILRYIDLLEKTFVIFRLYSLSRNLRNEIGKKVKIYFYDLGIRNIIIQNTNDIDMRDDIGGLWENFCIVERKKKLQYNLDFANQYFWRNTFGAEVDYAEEKGGEIRGYEFKFSDSRYSTPKAFAKGYNAEVKLITRENFEDFVADKIL